MVCMQQSRSSSSSQVDGDGSEEDKNTDAGEDVKEGILRIRVRTKAALFIDLRIQNAVGYTSISQAWVHGYGRDFSAYQTLAHAVGDGGFRFEHLVLLFIVIEGLVAFLRRLLSLHHGQRTRELHRTENGCGPQLRPGTQLQTADARAVDLYIGGIDRGRLGH